MVNDIRKIYEKGIERTKREPFLTGFKDLDIFCKYLGGGDILTIGGRPGMGKTNFAVSLVNNILEQGKSVMYFSLEMNAERFINRLVAERLNVSLFDLRERVRTEEIEKALSFYDDKKIYICDRTSYTPAEMEDAIKEVKPDIVFIDYIQLLQMPKAPNLTEATNLAIREIKRIAAENNIMVVMLSQLSRAVESRCDKRPLLSDLRNGNLIEELSDIILMLYRDEYYNPEPDDSYNEIMHNEIIISKNSYGPVGIIMLEFKKGFFRNVKTRDTV